MRGANVTETAVTRFLAETFIITEDLYYYLTLEFAAC